MKFGFMSLLTKLLLISCLGAVVLLVYWDAQVVEQFENRQWQVPGKVYARGMDVYEGANLSMIELAAELERLRYTRVNQVSRPGTFAVQGNTIELATRGFRFWDGLEPRRQVLLGFQSNRLASMQALDMSNFTASDLDVMRLEPLLIGGFYPGHQEDRILLTLKEVPKGLIKALISVEDKAFYKHFGISPKAVLRASIANVKKGRVSQGGSTITQQLVKNYFLQNDRTWRRKVEEGFMAIFLDYHFEKDDILEAYLNEVYLGQSGSRAIHGFGLASLHYFGLPLQDLALEQWALLVALVKGPSYFDPRRFPERARARRDWALGLMYESDVMSITEYEAAVQAPLGVLSGSHPSVNRYPAFMDLVREQLREEFPPDALSSEGLHIFTTLDPQVQAAAERSVTQLVPQFPQAESVPIQAAVVVSNPQNGEVLAIVGGRNVRDGGFNRALEAKRPVGSVVKPFVYLTAITKGAYHLGSVVSDEPFAWQQPDGTLWEPQNFSKRSHGDVLLQEALVNSYNQVTARLGVDIDIKSVANIIEKMGVGQKILAVPALALGAVDLSPFQVTQLYQTLAASGFNSRLKAIQAVMKPNGETLSRYPLQVSQVVPAGATFLIKYALEQVVQRGTAASIGRVWPEAPKLAGKTGTTDELRDSWFAGMSDNYVAVVWLGSDQNLPIGLTGAQGALRVWIDLLQQLPVQGFVNPVPNGYGFMGLHPSLGAYVDGDCAPRVKVALQQESVPLKMVNCNQYE